MKTPTGNHSQQSKFVLFNLQTSVLSLNILKILFYSNIISHMSTRTSGQLIFYQSNICSIEAEYFREPSNLWT